MTMYRLRDKERQEALEKAFPGFAERLKYAYTEEAFVKGENVGNALHVSSGASPYWTITFMPDEYTIVEEYDPKQWNPFPEFEPPDGVLMRVETRDDKKKCAYFHNFSDGGCWCDPDGSAWPRAFSDAVILFRPWED